MMFSVIRPRAGRRSGAWFYPATVSFGVIALAAAAGCSSSPLAAPSSQLAADKIAASVRVVAAPPVPANLKVMVSATGSAQPVTVPQGATQAIVDLQGGAGDSAGAGAFRAGALVTGTGTVISTV